MLIQRNGIFLEIKDEVDVKDFVLDDFDLDNLELSIETELLPHGTVRMVVDPYYDGEEFEFEGNTTKETRLYVIKSDGSRIDFQ